MPILRARRRPARAAPVAHAADPAGARRARLAARRPRARPALRARARACGSRPRRGRLLRCRPGGARRPARRARRPCHAVDRACGRRRRPGGRLGGRPDRRAVPRRHRLLGARRPRPRGAVSAPRARAQRHRPSRLRRTGLAPWVHAGLALLGDALRPVDRVQYTAHAFLLADDQPAARRADATGRTEPGGAAAARRRGGRVARGPGPRHGRARPRDRGRRLRRPAGGDRRGRRRAPALRHAGRAGLRRAHPGPAARRGCDRRGRGRRALGRGPRDRPGGGGRRVDERRLRRRG